MTSYKILVLLLMLSLLGRAQSPIDVFTTSEALQASNIGFCLKDAKTGELLLEHRSNKLLSPASALKVVTATLALTHLGSEYRFSTELWSNKESSEFYLVASGDPSLNSSYLKRDTSLIQWLKRHLSSSTEYKLWLVEPEYWQNRAQGYAQLRDLGNYYGADAHGFNWGDNTYLLKLKSGNPGTPVSILSVEPPQDIQFINELTAGEAKSGDNAYILGGFSSEKRLLQGTIPPSKSSFTIKGSMNKPWLTLQHELEVELPGAKAIHTAVPAPRGAIKIGDYTSPPLKQLLKEMLGHSINLYAEAILAKAAEVERKPVIELLSSYEDEAWKGVTIVDGSGLSPVNLLSAEALTNILVASVEKSYFSSLYNALPLAGEDGAMKYYFSGTPLLHNARLKTGHLSSVRAYSGYFNARSGRLVAVTLLINGWNSSPYAVKQEVQKLFLELYKLY